MARIRVLIVDDSAFMRHALARLLGEHDDLEVVGSAANGVAGIEAARELRPDVITLDVEMPVLDGLGMLRRLMIELPTRVVMLSSLTTEGAGVTLDALQTGAIDFVPKPSGSLSIDIGRVGRELVEKIRAAAAMPESAFLRHRRIAVANLAGLAARSRAGAAPRPAPALAPPPTLVARGSGADPSPVAMRPGRAQPERAERREGPDPAPRTVARRLVVVASSTGGPSALHTLAGGLPPHLGAAVVIVQHMPAGFTASLAGRLDGACPLRCAEAAADDLLVEDEVLVAPGDRHLIGSTSGHVQLVGLPPVNGVRPAADVTLQALAPIWRERLLCVVLTGMGCDGREGARAVKLHGGSVLAQDRATATIYGMPAAVFEAGLADAVVPLGGMAAAIATWCAAAGPVAERTPAWPARPTDFVS